MRLMVALSVAAVLAVFLLYTSFAGGATESLRPSQLMSGSFTGKEVQLAGVVTGPVTGDAHAGGKRFKLKDFDGPETVDVVYTGSDPRALQGRTARLPARQAHGRNLRRRRGLARDEVPVEVRARTGRLVRDYVGADRGG